MLEDDMRKAAAYLDPKLFIEYWGDDITDKININSAEDRISYWLAQADRYAQEWKPSDYLFL